MKRTEIGAWDRPYQYSIVGKPQDFYIFIRDDLVCSFSSWIKGELNLYYDLVNTKKKVDWIRKVKDTAEKYKKDEEMRP